MEASERNGQAVADEATAAEVELSVNEGEARIGAAEVGLPVNEGEAGVVWPTHLQQWQRWLQLVGSAAAAEAEAWWQQRWKHSSGGGGGSTVTAAAAARPPRWHCRGGIVAAGQRR